MIVISKTILNEFCDEYNAACTPLVNWYNETKKSDWSHFLDLKKSFRSADYVGNDRYVFNIKGNEYRLIALIIFKTRTVFILFIGSHKEYDKINAAEVQYLKKKIMKKQIKSKKEYHENMVAIYNLMNKGEKNLTKAELKILTAMSIAAENYEETVLGLKPLKEPETIAEIVELKLFENKMTQASLSDQIGISKSKVSEILNGKRKADIPFLKGIHKVLKIDAGLLLEKV